MIIQYFIAWYQTYDIMNFDLTNILQIQPTSNIGGAYIASIALILLSLGAGYIYTHKKSGHLIIDSIIGGMYDFFSDILGKSIPSRVIKNIITLFVVILCFNLFSVIIDVLKVGFPGLEAYHFTPTTDFNFTIALAIFTVGYLLFEEYKSKGALKSISSYIPLRGSGYLFPEGKMPRSAVDWISKFFDIIISLFIGMLDIIGQLAKIISLGGRLFGNMWSGGLLLAIAIGGGAALMSFLPGNIPAIVPVIVHIQGLFVAVVQALVFSLLIAIFVKLAYE